MKTSDTGTLHWKRFEKSSRSSRSFEEEGCPSWRINCNILEIPSCHGREVHLDRDPIVTCLRHQREMHCHRSYLLLRPQHPRNTGEEQDQVRILSLVLPQQWQELSLAVWPVDGLQSNVAIQSPKLFVSTERDLIPAWKELLVWKFIRPLHKMIQSLPRAFQRMAYLPVKLPVWRRTSAMHHRTVLQHAQKAHTHGRHRRHHTCEVYGLRILFWNKVIRAAFEWQPVFVHLLMHCYAEGVAGNVMTNIMAISRESVCKATLRLI